MNIVYVAGSPRIGGNSDTLAKYFLHCCQQQGATIQHFHLNNLNYRGCQACDACKKGADHCVLKDDLTPVLAAVFAADILVLATPVYYGDVTAQLKGFIDRTYSFLKPGYIAENKPSRFPKRKQLVFILAQGHRNSKLFADILPRYSDIFYWTGFAKTWPLRAVDVYHRGDVDKKEEFFRQAQQLSEQLMSDQNSADNITATDQP
ncbi:MAG: flavodoxin family protein [Desulfuromonas sp.]|nr:flavodoxin family protein [Desulfuromonas sp.]